MISDEQCLSSQPAVEGGLANPLRFFTSHLTAALGFWHHCLEIDTQKG
jgi:hypothetical protein